LSYFYITYLIITYIITKLRSLIQSYNEMPESIFITNSSSCTRTTLWKLFTYSYNIKQYIFIKYLAAIMTKHPKHISAFALSLGENPQPPQKFPFLSALLAMFGGICPHRLPFHFHLHKYKHMPLPL